MVDTTSSWVTAAIHLMRSSTAKVILRSRLIISRLALLIMIQSSVVGVTLLKYRVAVDLCLLFGIFMRAPDSYMTVEIE